MLPLAELPNVKNCLGKYAKDLGEIDVHNIEWICDLITRVFASGNTNLHDLYVKMPISCNDGFTAFRRLIDLVDCPVMVRYISPRIFTISEEFERVKQKICDVEKFYQREYHLYMPVLIEQTRKMKRSKDRILLQVLINHITLWQRESYFTSQREMIEENEYFFMAQNNALLRLINRWEKDSETLRCLYEARMMVYNQVKKPLLTIVR